MFLLREGAAHSPYLARPEDDQTVFSAPHGSPPSERTNFGPGPVGIAATPYLGGSYPREPQAGTCERGPKADATKQASTQSGLSQKLESNWRRQPSPGPCPCLCTCPYPLLWPGPRGPDPKFARASRLLCSSRVAVPRPCSRCVVPHPPPNKKIRSKFVLSRARRGHSKPPTCAAHVEVLSDVF